MTSKKQKQIHSHSFEVDGTTVTVSFDDKRTMNSLVNALEKAKSIVSVQTRTNSESHEHSINVETPNTFDGWKIIDKYDHIALKPPESHTKEEVTLMPDLSVEWNPTFTGKYWRDGMYHFFPKKTKLSAEFTTADIVNNLQSMGANILSDKIKNECVN
jgi:hypothetical protein